MLVANPAYATPAVQADFGRTAYHGMVVWSRQQTLMAAGLERQRLRTDLSDATRRHVVAAQQALWQAIEATPATRASELWS